MNYIYNDEDNLNEPEKKRPDNGCWNCWNYDFSREACTIRWNNLDSSYYNPDLDDRELTDCCEYHDPDYDADPEDIFGGEQE